MSALARHLQARNHDVLFLYSASANGLSCVSGGKDDVNANRHEIGQLEGFGALVFYADLAAKGTEAIFKSLPKLVSDAELFANRSALFTNGGEFRYAPL